MSTEDEPRDDNPFKGTPMEQFFAQMSGGQIDFAQLMGQFQRMMEPHDGAVNFTMSKDVARHTVAAAGDDPSPSATHVGQVDDAVRLAELWLDESTSLPAGALRAAAWSRAEWIENSMGTWQTLIEPIAGHVVTAMSDALPEEAGQMAGPLMGILSQAGSAMFAQQVGQGVGALAQEVLSSSDIGLPTDADRTAGLVVSNISALAAELELSDADLVLYVALRECAHQRLFAHAPWLRASIVDAVEAYGSGTTIDLSAIESQLGTIDPSQPESIQQALSSGLFEPATTPDQQKAKDRLELVLALVEGWVDEVVSQATVDKMPTAAALSEAMRRRRATGGPAEDTFASLVGLELRPRRLRDASNLWSAVRDLRGAGARDDVWSHPDLMPSSSDLDDPLGFVERLDTHSRDDFDAELGRLLDGDHDA
jgi:putative hydrolase